MSGTAPSVPAQHEPEFTFHLAPENAPPPAISYASHAARHPWRPVIPPSQKGGNSKVYDKQSKQVAWEMRREKQDEFIKDLTEYWQYQSKTCRDLAEKYQRKPEYVKKLLDNQTHYKQERSTNLFNAKVAWKCREMKEENQPMSLQELQAAVKADPELQNLSEQCEKELIDVLDEEKALKRTGVRISNRAATLDYQSVVNRVQQELTSLSIRTGITAFAFFSRTHINDTMQPVWISTPGALEFLPDMMRTTAGEMGRKFELWAVTDGGQKGQSPIIRMRAECAEIISRKLKEITSYRDASMNYKYYDVDVRSRYSVQLRGWPNGVQFVAPGNLTTMYEIRALHDALSSGSCCWALMSQREVNELKVQLGEHPIVKTRKPKKKRVAADVNESQQDDRPLNQARKKRKTAPKSAPTVSDANNA